MRRRRQGNDLVKKGGDPPGLGGGRAREQHRDHQGVLQKYKTNGQAPVEPNGQGKKRLPS